MSKKKQYREAVAEAVAWEIEHNPSVFVAGEDVRMGDQLFMLAGLYERFGPERVLDTPVSELAIGGLAVGAAAAGLRPIIDMNNVDFALVGMDQIVNQMAKLHYMFGGKLTLPIVMLMAQGGGANMGATHSQSLEAWFCHVPGLKVVMPWTPYDAKGLMHASIRDENPVIFLFHKLFVSLEGEVPDEPYVVPIGKADVKREGSDATVIATGSLVEEALQAAEDLAARGVSVEVVDPRTLTPLDMDTILASVRKTRRVVVAHEAVQFCGYGAEVAAQIQQYAFKSLEAPVMRVGAPWVPVPFSPPLEAAYMPGKAEIISAIEGIVPGAVRA